MQAFQMLLCMEMLAEATILYEKVLEVPSNRSSNIHLRFAF